jgi:MATE family multidrug resistance protein
MNTIGAVNTLSKEIPRMARFAFPIVFAQASFMFMGVIDTAMMGRLGSAELAGTGVARSLFWMVSIFACGILLAIDILASQALGAKRTEDVNSLLGNGLRFALWLAAIFTPLLFVLVRGLSFLNYDPLILEHARVYLSMISLSLPFMLLFTAMQRYWQSMQVLKPIVFIAIVANIINYAVNEILIFGRFGFDPLGVYGAGWATMFSRAFMCLSIAWLTLSDCKRRGINITFKLSKLFHVDKFFLMSMLRFGIPAAAHQTFEVSVFSLITILAAKLTADEAAAHQIVFIICSFTFMVPMGIANAAAFRVGHLVGQGEYLQAKWAGHAAIFLGAAVMFFTASTMLAAPYFLLSIFTTDVKVIELAKGIIIFGATFQIFDAIQGCAIGALRGAGNTTYAPMVSVVGFYPIALFLGSLLCFYFDMRLHGLWIGLLLGLSFIAVFVLYFWITIKPISVFSTRPLV